MTRERPADRFVPVGRLCAGTGFAALALLALARPVAAEDPERYNCPDGFDWIRMSGTACVQQRDTLPTNGKIGYDGHALCIDPFMSIYEARPTTDGKGVPGNPATSYAYLLECVTQDEFAARQTRAAEGAQLGDASRLLADRGSSLPPGELVLLGALGTGALIFAALPVRRGGPAVSSVTSAPASEPIEDPAGAAAREEAARRIEELQRRAAELDEIDKRLAAQVQTIREAARANQISILDVIQLAGIASDVLGALPIPQAQIPAALVSGFANLSGIAVDALELDPTEVYRRTRELLGDIAHMRGIIAGERDSIGVELQALAAAASAPPEVSPADPAVLPDATLLAERERTQQRVLGLQDAIERATDDWIRLRGMRSIEEDRAAALRNALRGVDDLLDFDVGRDANTAVNVTSGLDGAILMREGEKLEAPLEEASQAIDSTFRSGSWSALQQASLARDGVAAEITAVERSGRIASAVGAGTAGVSAIDWWGARTSEEARVLVEQSIEGHQYLAGRLDQDTRAAEARLGQLRQQADGATARRRALSAEIDMRAARSGHLLWPQ